MRALIAGRVTLGCALLGVAAFMEPRSNEVRGLPEPEERIPTQLWRMHDRGIHVAPIEKLKLARQEKKNKAGILSKPPYIGSQPSHVASKLCGHSFAGPSHPVQGSLL